MKNIIIFGTSRAGKTELATYLHNKLNYNIISIDLLVSAFQYTWPNLGITHKNRDGKSVENFSPFLNQYIMTLNYYNYYKYVIEGVYITLEDLLKLSQFHTLIVLTHGIGAVEIFNNLKKYDNRLDWTKKLNDSELMKYCENIYKHEQEIVKFCDTNNIKYFKTGIDRRESFNDIYNKLVNGEFDG